MRLNRRTRQIHRWTSLVFTLAVVINFAALGLGEPAYWIYFLPLPPLALLLLTGLYLFLLPYAATWRGVRRPEMLGG
jgi:hypothetical protein